MLFRQPEYSTRTASPADRNALTAFTHRASRVHAHLDWQPAEDWLGSAPFLVLEDGQRLLGALACPPDPPDTAWIRLLAFTSRTGAPEWNQLWPAARTELERLGVREAAVLSLAGWIDSLCLQAGFVRTHQVVVLSRSANAPPEFSPSPAQIRPARPADEAAMIAADTGAFAPPWQHSPMLLRKAFKRASYLSVAELDGQVVGYQLSTPGVQGMHLARLAVLPAWQRRGIGAALLADMLAFCAQGATRAVTVNTQDTNQVSLTLYQRLGFSLTGVRYPVYQLALA